MTRTLPSVTVSDKGERKIKSSHPWVFGDEVTPRGEISPEDGGLCDVYSGKDRYLGTGFFNSHSKIRVRLFSDNANDTFDDAFFRRRIAHAVDYRITVMGPDFDACRLIFGEADRFPGWTVDRFGGYTRFRGTFAWDRGAPGNPLFPSHRCACRTGRADLRNLRTV